MGITGSIAWYTYVRPLRMAYKNFYENYDPQAEAEKYTYLQKGTFL